MKKKSEETPQSAKTFVQEFVERLQSEGASLSELELAFEAMKQTIGCQGMAEALTRLPEEDGRKKKCPRCKTNCKVRSKNVARTIETLSGTHTFRRHYYYCEKCRAGFFPRDIELGLPERGEVSKELEKRLLDFGINDCFEEASERIELHYGLRVSSHQLRQIIRRLGDKANACDFEDLQEALSPASGSEVGPLYVMTDGSMISTREGWKEVKVAVLFRKGAQTKKSGSSRGLTQNARYVAVLGDIDRFHLSLSAALDVEREAGVDRIIWLGDGAPWNFNLAKVCERDALQILDIYHAIENGMDCGKKLLGEESVYLDLWKQALERHFYEGSVEDLIDELMDCLEEVESDDALEALDDLVRYYRNNAHRMHYKSYLTQGLMIGSGPVESAHRHVIQKRMKQAGQHWSIKGARHMATLRAAYRTAGALTFHDALYRAHRKSQFRGPVRSTNHRNPKKRLQLVS